MDIQNSVLKFVSDIPSFVKSQKAAKTLQKLQNGTTRVNFKVLPEHFKAQRLIDFEKSNFAEVFRLASKLELEPSAKLFQNKGQASVFQDRLINLYDNPDIKNDFIDAIVEKLNKNKIGFEGDKFIFADSKSYAKIKEAAAAIKNHGEKAKTGPQLSAAKIFGHYDDSSKEIVDTLPDSVFSFRIKTENGIRKKLMRKFNSGDLNADFNMNSAYKAIGDLFGERIQMKTLTPHDAANVIESLKDSSGARLFSDFDDFQKEILLYCEKKSKRPRQVECALEALKTKQTEGVIKKLTEAAENRRINITGISNYGDEITSYFTNKQIRELTGQYGQALRESIKTPRKHSVPQKVKFAKFPTTKKQRIKRLSVVSKPNATSDPTQGAVKSFCETTRDAVFTEKGAVKSSGYSSFHVDFNYLDPDVRRLLRGELQIRGSELNNVGEIEHIIYDCLQGKASVKDKKLRGIVKQLSSLTKNQAAEYKKYISDLYRWKRLKELGIEYKEPVFKNYSTGLDEKYSFEGLMKL